MTSMIRWQNHSYVLKQSLNFFQNDFAGALPSASCRPATRCVTPPCKRGCAVACADLRDQCAGAVRRGRLAPDDPAADVDRRYIGALYYFVPRVKQRSVEASDARSN